MDGLPLHRGDSFSALLVFHVCLLSKLSVLKHIRIFYWEHTGIGFPLLFSGLPGASMWCTVCASRSTRLGVMASELNTLYPVPTEEDISVIRLHFHHKDCPSHLHPFLIG